MADYLVIVSLLYFLISHIYVESCNSSLHPSKLYVHFFKRYCKLL
ncbi:hypothetical protein GLYMA_10G055350v4 [Glycine max]|nr:hypothetical protein GLYMA_10G055350v4 [Glycine max]KAH1136934.1 hypothetical protein GYH30_027065 [Glycine max]